MGNFLERWNDPGLDVDEDWDPLKYNRQQAERIAHQAYMAYFAEQVPRRLPDATPDELAADKKISKRVATRSESSLMTWAYRLKDFELSGEKREELRQQGAQIIWVNWFAEYKAFMQRELTICATTAIRTGHMKSGNSYCNRLLNELNTIGQLFQE